jgi:hypothetical protein
MKSTDRVFLSNLYSPWDKVVYTLVTISSFIALLQAFAASNHNEMLVVYFLTFVGCLYLLIGSVLPRPGLASYIKINQLGVEFRSLFFNVANIPWHQIVDITVSHNRIEVKTSETEVGFSFSSASDNEQKIRSLLANYKKGYSTTLLPL